MAAMVSKSVSEWWGGLNGCSTAAAKRYRGRIMRTTVCYLVVLFGCVRMVRQGHATGWELYLFALLPAIPVVMILVQMGRYLHEETDEYQRALMVRSLLVGTGAVMGVIVVSDFLRSFTPVGDVPPFSCFMVFFLSFGVAQWVQKLRDRPAADA